MEVQFYGANCLVMGSKHVRVVIDDNLAALGAKSVAKDGDIVLHTSANLKEPSAAKIIIDQAGEYEVSGVSVFGIPARAHMDEEGKKTAIVYKLVLEDINILVTGHIYPELSDAQLETIGMIDVMFVPVGGNGFTLDGVGALKLIKKVEPKIVVPTYYDDASLNFEVPAQNLEQALKAVGMEAKETITKLKIKAGELPAITQLIVVEKS